jgi:hypothetical protein
MKIHILVKNIIKVSNLLISKLMISFITYFLLAKR